MYIYSMVDKKIILFIYLFCAAAKHLKIHKVFTIWDTHRVEKCLPIIIDKMTVNLSQLIFLVFFFMLVSLRTHTVSQNVYHKIPIKILT